MENNLELKIHDIKKILIDKLDIIDETIFIDQDLYWNILDTELYDVYKDPKELTIGSIVEDYEFISAVIEGNRDIIDYDLYKLSSILKFLGKSMLIAKAQN
ncbi:MAG: hypothetical protein MUW56_09465 [Chryseobacterium sp.]|uniref:hypothetical protein n=1 Tax=Chryseobacterium sp. TaxID=1871047 RepID=UPI0025C34A81|nr:hypothetical protein [Chryseobacterium sp.]MCJ7933845.1 hypothetical protein [Chryseobacterium sp.]